MNKFFVKKLLVACALLLSYIGFSQVKNDFDVRYEADIRGEITFIANNIVNRQVDGHWEGAWVIENGSMGMGTRTYMGPSSIPK